MDTQAVRDHVTEELARQWGELVRARRIGLTLTLADVAELIGDRTGVQTLSKLELGEIVPRDYLKITVALALQCEVGELFPMPDRKRLRRFMKSVA